MKYSEQRNRKAEAMVAKNRATAILQQPRRSIRIDEKTIIGTMRTIKFRGKRVDNGEWVFGYYVSTHELHHTQQHTIFTDEYSPYSYLSRENFSVIPETVGQFTGLQDKNGKEIYEGDIDNNGNLIHYENGSWWSGGILLDWNIQFSNEFEIISNIHEGGNNVL